MALRSLDDQQACVNRFIQRQEQVNSENTAKIKQSDLRRFTLWLKDEFGIDDVRDVEPTHIDSYLVGLSSQDYASKTIYSRWTSINTFFDYMAGLAGEIEESPAESLDASTYKDMNGPGSKKSAKLKEEIQYASRDHVEAMIENVPAPKLRNELIIRLAYQTGMRQSEIVDVRLDDVDREEREIYIRGKGEKNRTVYYKDSLDILVNSWLNYGRDSYGGSSKTDKFIVTNRGGVMLPKRVSLIVREAAEKAGIQEVVYTDKNGHTRRKFTAHSLRHGFAVACLQGDYPVPIRALQKVMGHSSIDITEKYLQLTDEDTKEMVRRGGPG